MKHTMIGLAAACLAFGITLGTASAAEPAMKADSTLGKILVGPNGMTLYTFDKDKKGEAASACIGKCIAIWPPLVAPANAAAAGEWSTVGVTDKDGNVETMWAYKGSPLYFFSKDAKPGDVTGDGFAGIWHVVKE